MYLSLHCHHQNDSCIKMDSDESHFNISLIVRDSHETVSTDHNFFIIISSDSSLQLQFSICGKQASVYDILGLSVRPPVADQDS